MTWKMQEKEREKGKGKQERTVKWIDMQIEMKQKRTKRMRRNRR